MAKLKVQEQGSAQEAHCETTLSHMTKSNGEKKYIPPMEVVER